VIYHAYGLRIDSEFELPLVPGFESGAADVAVVAGDVELETIAFAPLDGVEDIDAVWVDQGWGEGRAVLVFPHLAAELSFDRPTIMVDARQTNDRAYVAHLVLDHILPRWLAMEGELVLHGGAVESPSGHAVVFIGNTGVGKSTTTTGVARAGWRLLGDDCSRILSNSGEYRVVPSYSGIRLLPDSRVALLPGAPTAPMADGASKRRVEHDLSVVSEAVRLGMVVELADPGTSLRVDRLTLSESTVSLARHTFHLARAPAMVATQAFELCSEVATRVPCVRLTFPRRWDVFDEIVAVLDQIDSRVR
jgi:hypothetical protein